MWLWFDHIYIAGDAGVYILKNDLLTDVRDESIIASSFTLYQNYPNPFNPTTVISWQLAVGNKVDLSIYNILGQKVATLVSGKKAAGFHQVEFNAQNLSSGIYLYRINADTWSDVKKMILLKWSSPFTKGVFRGIVKILSFSLKMVLLCVQLFQSCLILMV